jgi:hypothetical protein
MQGLTSTNKQQNNEPAQKRVDCCDFAEDLQLRLAGKRYVRLGTEAWLATASHDKYAQQAKR